MTDRTLVDDDGVVWRVRVQGPAGFGHDAIRFTGPQGQVRIGSIPERSWDDLTEEALDRAFLRSQLLPR